MSEQSEIIKPPGEPMRYRRDVSRGLDRQAMVEETEHVREHLASLADADDDPTTRAEDVEVNVVDHVDGDAEMLSIVGELDAEPDAPYLRDDYDPEADAEASDVVFTRYSPEDENDAEAGDEEDEQ